MRVRRFELRLVAAALIAGWAAAAALVLLAYRPGGPLDLFVGLAMALPAAIAVVGFVWPPVTRGDRAFAGMVWLGIGAWLCLAPSILGLVEQLRARGSQTLLPSPEAAYPWLLALGATCLFSGLGLARRLRGATALRRQRFVDGALIAILLTVLSATVFASVAVANELAVRDQVAAASVFGPIGSADPPLCDDQLAAGAQAILDGSITASVDQRPIGTIDLSGERVGTDFRWTAYVATDRRLGLAGVTRIGKDVWWREPGGAWVGSVDIRRANPEDLDLQVMRTVLTSGIRATAEDHGVEVVGGARARRCRVAIDGATFLAAFPQVSWLVGDVDLRRWTGQLDYWVFLDGQLGQITGSAGGEATGIVAGALQATITIRLTATGRDRDLVVYPPS